MGTLKKVDGHCLKRFAEGAIERGSKLRTDGWGSYRSVAKTELVETLAMIDRGMEDIRSGRTQPAKPALEKIADKLGLKLDR